MHTTTGIPSTATVTPSNTFPSPSTTRRTNAGAGATFPASSHPSCAPSFTATVSRKSISFSDSAASAIASSGAVASSPAEIPNSDTAFPASRRRSNACSSSRTSASHFGQVPGQSPL